MTACLPGCLAAWLPGCLAAWLEVLRGMMDQYPKMLLHIPISPCVDLYATVCSLLWLPVCLAPFMPGFLPAIGHSSKRKPPHPMRKISPDCGSVVSAEVSSLNTFLLSVPLQNCFDSEVIRFEMPSRQRGCQR